MRVRIEDIIEELLSHHESADEGFVRRAYILSAQEHKDQKRRSGEPYLIHPLEVSMILAKMGMDDVAIVVGLLHDVLEDGLSTPESLSELFGDEVLHIVDGVTKISQLPFNSQEEEQASNFRKMLLHMVDDIRVIVVKLADRLHNMRTLQYNSSKSQIRNSRETMDIYVPIAHRLGMGSIKQELEDLCFKYLEPERYEAISNKLERELPVNKEAIGDVRKRMEQALVDNKIPCKITWRLKSVYGIYNKTVRLEKTQNETYEFHDYIAFRIITDEIINCYAALGILHSMWKPVHGQFDDYIANPKPNNYQSLHTVLVERRHRFEVQIRTDEMHQIAEKGIAAHWRYKEGGSNDEQGMGRYYEWVRELLEGKSDVENPQEWLQDLKADLLPHEIYTFTPMGKLMALPKNATPIDFAYTIHTNVGHSCVGSRVNGSMVPLNHQLQSGDTVEIITSRSHSPSRDWLNIVVSGKARSKIRHYINRQEKDRSVELGAKMLEKELRNNGIALKRLLANPNFEEAAKGAGFSTIADVQSAIWYGKISARSFIYKVFPELTEKEEKKELSLTQRLADKIKKSVIRQGSKVMVKGSEDILTYMAPCCSPVYGESIIGYITRGKGVAVHRIDCGNIREVDPERQINVNWSKLKDSVMPVRLLIRTEDEQGLLARMIGLLDSAGVNLKGISADTYEDKTAEISMTIEIKDIRHLNTIIKGIGEIQGVLSISRK